MAKSTKIIAALGVVAGLGVAAMPLASYAATSVNDITDNISVTVSPLCTFQTDTDATNPATTDTHTGVNAYSATIANGDTATVGTHYFNVRCNNNTGYTVKAYATGLTDSAISADINFVVANDFETKIAADNKASGAWTAIVDGATSGNANTMIAAGSGADANEMLASAHAIKTTDAANTVAGERFEVEYKAYIGTDTQAGTYTGTVVYNLAANPAS